MRTINLNSIPITKRGTTTFVPLPSELRRPIVGGCTCKFCKAHPDKTPTWDTLAVDRNCERTWTVHYPEIATT